MATDPSASGWALGIFPDRERADDQVVEHDGAAVLLVAQEIAEKVEDTTSTTRKVSPDRDS